MNSFILVSKNLQQQESYLKDFIKKHAISPFDINTSSEEKSTGIEIVRKLQETLFLKPYKGKEKIIVIQHAENLTIEAQNALLKLLEEPPIYTYIFLCSTKEEVFLPTILSRCKVLVLETTSNRELSAKDRERYAQNLACVLMGSIGEKLALAETLAAERDNVGKWFETMIYLVRNTLFENLDTTASAVRYAKILEKLQEGYKTFITTNVHPRTLLEHIFLTIEQ